MLLNYNNSQYFNLEVSLNYSIWKPDFLLLYYVRTTNEIIFVIAIYVNPSVEYFMKSFIIPNNRKEIRISNSCTNTVRVIMLNFR